MTKRIDIHGYCAPEFEAVKTQFEKHFRLDNEIGASVSMTYKGETVVDLWAGTANLKTQEPWQKDTIATVFSGTKALSSMLILRLADQGKIDLDAPVTHYWPEFGQKGKSHIKVKHLLSHQAGLPGPTKLVKPWVYKDVNALADVLAESKPWWREEGIHGYHAITMGWLLARLVYNVTGKTLGTLFDEEIANPLGLDIHIGMEPRHHQRVARMELISNNPPVLHRDLLSLLSGAVSKDYRGMVISAFTNPLSLGLNAIGNTKRWPELEQPAANGMSNARNLATLYGILATGGVSKDGYQLLSENMLEKCWEEQSFGYDQVLRRKTRFSHGFMLSIDEPLASYGPGTRSFGHNGMGGSLAFADPDNEASFGYVMNRMGTYLLVDSRARALIDTFYRCL